jgi:site-specific DNA recombinase
MNKWLIYSRISSDPKHDMLGVERQLKECRELAARLGGDVVDVFIDDDVSAYSGKRRPRYEALLTAIVDKVGNGIIAWHPDRLHRSPRELESFIDLVEAHKTKIQTVQAGEYDLATASGRMTARVVGAVSRHESEHKGERVKAKLRQNAAAGKPMGGGTRCYGYADDKMTIVPVEAKFIRAACKKLLNGETLRGTTQWLNTQGSTTVSGREWTPSRVRSFAVNPRYAGLRASGKGVDAHVTADATWKPIVDRATHDRLRSLLLDPARRRNRSARSYLLSSLLICGRCGNRMLSRPKSGRTDPVEGGTLRQYSCAADPGRMGCGRCSIRARELEEFIGDAVVAQFMTMAKAGLFVPEPIAVDDEISAEIEALDRKAAMLGDQWGSDLIGDAAFAAATSKLIARRSELSTLVRRSVRNTPPMLADLAAHPERVAKLWEDVFTFDQKRALIMALVESVTITPNPGNDKGFDSTRVSVAWKAQR